MSTYNRVVAADSSASLAPTVRERLATDLSGTFAVQHGGRVTVMGDSISGSGIGTNWFEIMCQTSGGGVFSVGNKATPGGHTETMLARFDADINPLSPDVVFIMAGTNNLNDVPYVPATYIDNVRQMVVKTRNLHAIPVVLSIPPNTANRARVASFNRGLANMCAAHNVIYVDIYSPLVDASTGTYISGYSSDGVHPNIGASAIIASTVLAHIDHLLHMRSPWLAAENADSANLLTNPLFITDSNADGTANNVAILYPNAAYTRTIVATTAPAKGNIQRNTMADSTTYQRLTNTTTTGFSVGDLIHGSVRLTASGLSGTDPRWTLYYIRDTGGPSNTAAVVFESGLAGDFLIEFEFTVPVDTTVLGLAWQASSKSGTSSMVVDASQLGLYNLTAAGSLT